jgi:hypothetical protein
VTETFSELVLNDLERLDYLFEMLLKGGQKWYRKKG